MATKNYFDYTQEELDAMTPEQRAWASLDYTYGLQREDSAREYARAVSQSNNQMLGRGMQRSSYGAQVAANLQQKGLEARNQITGQQNAAYSNQRYQIERDAEADRQWQAQYAQSYISQILANGGTPSDELLAQAGLSRADFEAMKPQATGGGGGWSGGYSYGGGGGGKGGTKSGVVNPLTDAQKRFNTLMATNIAKTTVGAANTVAGLTPVVTTFDTRSAANRNVGNTTGAIKSTSISASANPAASVGKASTGSSSGISNLLSNIAKKDKR